MQKYRTLASIVFLVRKSKIEQNEYYSIGPELIGFNSLNSFELLISSQISHWPQIWALASFALFCLALACTDSRGK
jgi:hypothetical protein